jgi:hypothetical protein
MLSTILIVLLILVLVGTLPGWGWSARWGNSPGVPGIVGAILVVLLILYLMGYRL